jgi:hypothetical protein
MNLKTDREICRFFLVKGDNRLIPLGSNDLILALETNLAVCRIHAGRL